MERLVGKVLNVVDGETIEVEIAPLNPRLELFTDGWSGHHRGAASSGELLAIETVRLAHREAPEGDTLESELAGIDLHRKLFWKRVELNVLSRDGERLVCDVRAVG
jgi:hypothetical protein